jgi:hypothetical protein
MLGAQVCIGNASLTNAAANLGGSVAFFDGGKQYGAGAVFGSELFFAGDFSFVDFDDTTLSLKSLGASVGYEFPSESEASICLGATGSYSFGLEILGVDITSFAVGPVLAVGVEAEVSPTVVVIPFAQLGWFYESITADGGPLGEETETDDYGSLGLGLSLWFNEIFALGTTVRFPLGVEGGNTTFGVGLAVSVGRN